MKDRYYVVSVQFNKISQAENRSVPKAYNNYNDALKEFHRQLASDMGNETLGWSWCTILNKDGLLLKNESWIADDEVEQE